MARYEQLRYEGMQRTMSRELDIFLAEGMCAWMHAWLSLPVETAEGFEKGREAGFNAAKNEGTYFSGIRSEVVNFLAAMSLGQLRGDEI